VIVADGLQISQNAKSTIIPRSGVMDSIVGRQWALLITLALLTLTTQIRPIGSKSQYTHLGNIPVPITFRSNDNNEGLNTK
jgi:hypothetical protein